MNSDIAIKVESLSKTYRLGRVNHKTFQNAVKSFMARLSGGNDPNLLIEKAVHGSERYDAENNVFWALKDVSFEIKRGDRVGIVGKNGAGKSTLLKILSRITTPTYGKVGINGRVASLLEVGTGFHPELTGRENIFLSGAILGMPPSETKQKLDQIIEFAEMGDFVDTPVKRYSSGMFVRLGFSIAAHLNPDILILDEVLAVGDAAFQEKCTKKVQELTRDGDRTVLFVSHDARLIEKICQYTLRFDGGRLVEKTNQVL